MPGSFAVRPHTFDGKLQSTGQIEKQLQIKEKKKAFDFSERKVFFRTLHRIQYALMGTMEMIITVVLIEVLNPL